MAVFGSVIVVMMWTTGCVARGKPPAPSPYVYTADFDAAVERADLVVEGRETQRELKQYWFQHIGDNIFLTRCATGIAEVDVTFEPSRVIRGEMPDGSLHYTRMANYLQVFGFWVLVPLEDPRPYEIDSTFAPADHERTATTQPDFEWRDRFHQQIELLNCRAPIRVALRRRDGAWEMLAHEAAAGPE